MKTTKTHVEPVSSVIQYQLRKGIKSITVGGKSDLMDLEIDKKGNVTLVMNADKDKLDVKKFEEYKNAFIDFMSEYDNELFKYLSNKEWLLKTDTPNLITISYEPTEDPNINKTILNILHDSTKLNISDFDIFREDNQQIINKIQEKVINHTETLTRLETTTDTLTTTLNDTVAKTTDNTNNITENSASIEDLTEKTQKLELEKATLEDLIKLSEKVENDIKAIQEKGILNDTNIEEIVNNFETIENDLDAHKKAVKDNLKVNNLKLDDLENIAQELSEKINNIKKVEVVGNYLIGVEKNVNDTNTTFTVITNSLEETINEFRDVTDRHTQLWNNLMLSTDTPDLINVRIDRTDLRDHGINNLKVSASENLKQKLEKIDNINITSESPSIRVDKNNNNYVIKNNRGSSILKENMLSESVNVGLDETNNNFYMYKNLNFFEMGIKGEFLKKYSNRTSVIDSIDYMRKYHDLIANNACGTFIPTLIMNGKLYAFLGFVYEFTENELLDMLNFKTQHELYMYITENINDRRIVRDFEDNKMYVIKCVLSDTENYNDNIYYHFISEYSS